MRQDPIEIAMTGTATRKRSAEQRPKKFRGATLASEPCIVDEAFARLDGPASATSGSELGDRRMMKQSLVSDLVAQLEAIDRQRERLAQLLESVELNSIAD